jgi:electron transport complex protein RnfB
VRKGSEEPEAAPQAAGPDGDAETPEPTRRDVVRLGLQGLAAAALGGLAVAVPLRRDDREWVWQLDPDLCIQCEGCAENCVRAPSAVRCFHAFDRCGYCELCFGYFVPGVKNLTEGAENQTCPSGAIRRHFVEPPYFEYTIDEELCIGCGRCVKGCRAFGNGSLYLQVRQDLCLHCNECSIARACPAGAFRRVPAARPYLGLGP